MTVPARPGIPADSGIGSNDLGGPGQEPLPPGAALPPRATPNGHFLRRGGRQGLRAALVQADGAGGGSVHAAGICILYFYSIRLIFLQKKVSISLPLLFPAKACFCLTESKIV